MTHTQAVKFRSDQERLFEFMHLPFPYRRPKSQWLPRPNRNKILSLSDPHVQFHNRVVFSHALKNEKDAATLVVPGDLGDYYSKSRFKKTRVVPFNQELRAVFFILEWMATNWRDVRIMIGNHDNRPEKHLLNTLGSEIDLLIITEANMLKQLAAYFDNVRLVGTQLDKTDINLTHIYQHGDIIFTHGEISLKANSANLDRVQTYLSDWGGLLNLRPWRVIAQGHNHRDTIDSSGPYKRFLLPTASNPFSPGFEYIYSSRMIGRPPSIGYSIFYQYNGETDCNGSKNVIFPVRHGRTEPLPVYDAKGRREADS